jgi:hypothetical protein
MTENANVPKRRADSPSRRVHRIASDTARHRRHAQALNNHPEQTMQTRWQSAVSSGADLAYLTLITLLAGLGVLAAWPSGPFPHTLAVLTLLQLTLLAWALERPGARASLGYALKVEMHALAQVFMGVFVGPVPAVLMLFMLHAISPAPGLIAHFTPANLVRELTFLVPAGMVMTLVMTAWRLHALRKLGLRLCELDTGALNTQVCRVAGTAAAAQARLEHYLTALTGEHAAGLGRLWYGKKPVITRRLSGDEVVFELTWAWCPSKVCIVVQPDGPVGACVHATCVLRGGYYKTELIINPIDALALHTYLQTNVFQLLSSDMALRASASRQDTLRNQATEMQLRILQAQIEPHFLFNTLANVRHLYRSSVEGGEAMMDHLIAYLRSTLDDLRSDASTVGREMDLVLHYLAIMKIRMGERLSYTFILADELASAAFPPAMLITLVENAIIHGLQHVPEGSLTISAAREGDHLRLTVLDNGPGFSSVQGSGVGLSNIRQRLEAIYGNAAWLEVGALHSGGFMASIVLPFPESV